MTLVVGMLVTTLAGAQESAPRVTISAVDDAELTPMVPVAGTVHSRHATTITAGLAARLAWIAEPGDFIATGDPVATFDCEMIKLRREEQVEQTRLEEIRLASLTREVQRLEQAELAVPATQLAQLRADREMSASQLRIAGVRVRQTENELRRCTAVAPFDGVVLCESKLPLAYEGDALFHIAKADTFIHENELLFLEDIVIVFGFDKEAFEGLKARHMLNAADNPYRVLGVSPDLSFDELRLAYRQRLRDNHPDKLMARGVPPEFVAIANERMAALNVAWETIEKLHKSRATEAS